MNIAELRQEYRFKSLDENDVAADPLQQFQRWFEEALNAQLPEPNAMTLATATRDGRPSARIVLLKGADQRGFVFFTNYRSRKGREIEDNPQASLTFLWIELERQVRIEGRVEKVPRAESEQYFAGRPLPSRIGALASPQSEVLPERAWLEARFVEAQQRFGDNVPCPEHWGGYRVVPEVVEFWQGRVSRLHDRLVYRREGDGWRVERLGP